VPLRPVLNEEPMGTPTLAKHTPCTGWAHWNIRMLATAQGGGTLTESGGRHIGGYEPMLILFPLEVKIASAPESETPSMPSLAHTHASPFPKWARGP